MSENAERSTIDANELRILLIRLAECHFVVNPEFTPEKEKNFTLNFTFAVERVMVSPTRGAVRFQVSAFEGLEDAPFQVSVMYEGVFEANEGHEAGLAAYMKVHALATLTPYIRETLSSISVRAGFPPLILPPLNIVALAKQLDEVEAQSERSSTEP